jgi:DNA/RNA-binding domain of Phe-tRNA-synthetase-like protein
VISIDAHPSLAVEAFETRFPEPLGARPALPWIHELRGVEAPGIARSESVRQAVRELLRAGGYKPTGRGKPSSEYLARTAEQGGLPRINAAVDLCNAVSLASGLPISLIDLDRSAPPWRISLAGPGMEYVFNPSGQRMALEGLLCLFDAEGPCANPVKDAQRTKTGPETTRTLTVIWAPASERELLARAASWYRELLARAGAATQAAALRGP